MDELKIKYADLQLSREELLQRLRAVEQAMQEVKRQIAEEHLKKDKDDG